MPKPGIENDHYSVKGQPIEVYVFGEGRKTALVMSAVHGDEPDGVHVVNSMLTKLTGMPADALSGTRVVLLPVANPDGLAAGTRSNANGIDLNRNFPDRLFGTGETSGKFFGGTSAASEPETRAIMEIIDRHDPYLIISLHAAMACVNYNGPSIEVAEKISAATGLPVTGDIGYPTPGSMGNYYGFDLNLPLITLELPPEVPDPGVYARVLLEVLGIAAR